MSILDKAERALGFLRAADKSKSHEVRAATGTLGRCLGTLGSRPGYTRHYAYLLQAAVPTLLSLASNDSAEIRLVGDEALNRAVVGGFSFYAHKINITLQNQIDHTKNERWIRAALTRICLGDSWLRPGVGKIRSQAQTLFPKLTLIVRTASNRRVIAETLESTLPRILTALADYSTDEELNDLCLELMLWMDDPEPAVRRGAGTCVAILCKHRTNLVPKLLDTVVDKLYPEATDTNAIHGWFGAVKSLLQVNSVTSLMQEEVFTPSDFLELYQLCIMYLESPRMEHNTHNAVMECIAVLVSCDCRHALLEKGTVLPRVGRRRISANRKRSRATAVLSMTSSAAANMLSDELTSDQYEPFTFSGALHLGSLSQLQTPRRSIEDLTLKTPDSAPSETDFEMSASENLSKQLSAKLEGIRSEDEDMKSEYLDEGSIAVTEDRVKISIGTLYDDDIPLKYLTRLLTYKFLLTGHGGAIPDRTVRVSVKASALNCLTAVLQLFPQALTMYLDNEVETKGHNISGASEGADSNQENTSDFILERNVCYQDSFTDSFSLDILNKSIDSHAASQSSRANSKRELYKSTGGESTDPRSSIRDVPSNILDSKQQSAVKNDLLTSGQSADSTNPHMTISNFTSNSNMTASNDPLSTEYPQTSSNDVISSSIDLDIKFDHFGESTTNIDIEGMNLSKQHIEGMSTKPHNERNIKASGDVEKTPPKRPLTRTDERQNKDVLEDTKEKCQNDIVDTLTENQHMSDIVILLENHCDPQIRGLVRVAISSYLFSALDLSHGDLSRWRHYTMLPKNIAERISVSSLVDIIVKGLSDEIHSCVNHSLTALGKILEPLTRSVYSSVLPTVLNALVDVETNAYWLCKVTLCKLYKNMPYERLSMVYPSYHTRSTLIMEVLYRLLADQDEKVRQAAASTIAEIVPKIQQPAKSTTNSILTRLAVEQTEEFNFSPKDLALSTLKRDYFQSDLPEQLRDTNNVTTAENLGEVVTELVSLFMESSCKFYSEGILEALLSVVTRWPPWQHQSAYLNRGLAELCVDTLDHCSNPVPVCSTLLALATAIYPLDICESIRQKQKDIFENDYEVIKDKWQHLQNEKCCQLAEKFLQITLKMLNILVHLIEEINPNVSVNKTGITLPGSPVRRKTSDAIPRRSSLASDVGDDKTSGKKKPTPSGAGHARSNFLGQFVNEPFYMKLYDNLKAVYSNHKLNLDQKSSMFYTFMSNVLDALTIQLEFATEKEFGCVTEEILYYLKTILPLRADKTVFCVTQMLKCLFGTNMVNQFSDHMSVSSVKPEVNQENLNFFDSVIMVNSIKYDLESSESDASRRSSSSSNMSQKMKLSIDSKNPKLVLEKQLLEKMETFAKNKSDRKWNTNKKELERYIKMFEPLVIQALKSYTMQNNISLQCVVLGLLNQLLTLRVNYCMLDSDQVFINLLLEQLDLVEQNEIPNSSKLVNGIMTFLVQLSSSKHHTKQLMEIPKLIQLCDGLTASGRRADCASALRPLAARVFWSCRHYSAPAPHQEISVTREVLLYMLQKSMCTAEVLNMVSCVLALSQEHPDSYYRWSELVADTLLNLLSQRAIELNSREAVTELERLMDSVYKEVLLEQTRVEAVLKILFAQPPEQATSTLETKERYLATVMVLLQKIIVNVPETEIILSIDYLKASYISPLSIFFNVKTDIDPLNVHSVNENCANLSPDVILVRFLFKILTYVVLEVDKCDEIECTRLDNTTEDARHRLLYAVAINIVCQVKHILHLTNGCLFPLTAKTAQSVLHNEQSGLNTGLYSPEENIPLEKLNLVVVRLSYRIPLFTVHWSHLLIRLKFLEQKYWQTLLGYMRNSPLSPENGKGHTQLSLLQIGCFMAYCEYFVESGLTEVVHLTWLLVNRVHILVTYYKEAIVRALVEKVHENSSASGLLLQAIAARCQHCIKDEYALNTYRMLSNCHESQSGSLVFLICRILGKLEPATASRFARLAVQRTRMLKTMDVGQIGEQLSKEDVQVALEMLQRDKAHLRFSSLVMELNTLASTVFDLSPLDVSQDRSINPQYIVTTNVDSGWLMNQIKSRCCQSSIEVNIRKDRPQDLASLLLNLSQEELNPILSCPEFDRRILHSSFMLSCDNYIREFLKVVAVYESKEIERENAKKNRLQEKRREEQITSNIDSNILNVATTLTKFRKGSEGEATKSQFFIPMTENKESKFEEKFGNLEITEDQPNDITIPEISVLFTSSQSALEKSLTSIIKLFPKQNRPLSQSENFNLTLEHTIDRYTRRCHQVFQDKQFYQEYCIVQNILSGYLEALHRLYAFLDTLDCDISEKVLEKVIPGSLAKSIAIFTVISLQYLSFLIKNKKIVQSPIHGDVSFRAATVDIDKIVVDDVIDVTLINASSSLSFTEIWNELNAESNSNRIHSAISCLYAVVKYCVKDTKPIKLKRYVRSDDTKMSDIWLTRDKLVTLLDYWESTFYGPGRWRGGHVMPQHWKKTIEMLFAAVARLDLVCNVALIPPLAWPAVQLDDKHEHAVRIDLPLQAFQDMDVLESFLFRVNFIGRWSKKTFEEIWMCLLAALQGNGTHWAVRGVMQLLLGSIPTGRRLGRPGSSLLHCPRDYVDDSTGMQRLRSIVVGMPIYGRLYEQVNLERIPFLSSDAPEPYTYGQFNSEYLRLASEITDDASFRVRWCLKRVRRYTEIDANSCLQLLMDVAAQMLHPKAPTGLSARIALISCIVNVSDLFTSSSQWYYLAQQLASLTSAEHKSLTQYCVPSQYLLYGLAKALTVLEGCHTIDEMSSVYQKLVKWLTSSNAALRQCALRGCLLLLSSPTYLQPRSQAENPRRQLVVQLAGVCRQYLSPQYRISLCEQSLYWSVLFKLVELGHTDLMNIAVDFILSNTRHPCADLVVKGITTMIRINVLSKDLKKSVVVRLINNRGDYAEHQSIQVLMVHLFSAHDKLLSPRLTADVSNMDPDVLMTSMERVTLLYKLLRDSTDKESMTVAAAAMKYFLIETLPPAATLSRVVIEFLECCRETERHEGGVTTDKNKWMTRAVLNAEVVFEVFQTAVAQSQLPVLTGWIFEALFHLLGGKISDNLLPYCLLCLLFSASGNQNLRKMAPLTFHNLKEGFAVFDRSERRNVAVRSKMSFNDRRLLCIVALHSQFTKAQLDKLRELCEESEAFEDLLNCLLSA